MTYQENIERLRQRGRYNLEQRKANARARIGFINEQEKEAIENINKASDLLVGKRFGSPNIASGEGGLIPFKYGEYIEEQERKGIEAEKLDRARKVAELEKKLQKASDIDTAHLNVKYDMLINGYLYEDADRFAQLSPHAQTAYARRKLGLWKESVADKLNYKMAKDNTEYHLKNWPKPLTAEGIHNDPLVPPLVKEAFVDRVLQDLIEENGINGFSDELLELEGINDYVNPETGQIEFGAHSKAKNKIMSKYRKNYNISSSNDAKVKLLENFKSDRDLLKLHSGLKGLYDPKSDTTAVGNVEAWNGIVALLSNMIVADDDFEEDDVYDIFKQDSPTVPGQTLYQSHRKWYDKIIQQAGLRKQQNAAATAALDAEKGSEFKKGVIMEIKEGGDLYKEIEKATEGKKFQERAAIINQALMGVQAKWIQAGGTWQTVGPNGEAITMAPWLNDIYSDLVYEDQEELLANAMAKLDIDQPILPGEWEALNPASKATLRRHKNWGRNQGLILKNALQYRTVTPKGEPGYEFSIPTMIKEALETAQRDTTNGALNERLYQRNLAIFKKAWDEAWLDKSGTMDGTKAFNYAMGEVRYNLGRGPNSKGEMRDADKVDDDLKWKHQAGENIDISKNRNYYSNRGGTLAKLLEKANEGFEGKITEQALYIPSLGPETAEFKQLVKYADGKGPKPKIYNWIAGYLPGYTAEDLMNWQLAQVGKTLPTSSAVNEAMKITESLAGFNRLIGFKTNSTDLHQAKIIALDGKKFCLVPEFVGGEDLKFTPPNKRDKGAGLIINEETGETQSTEEQQKTSNQIYIDKGFHENDPGPRPEPQDFPIQPGDPVEPFPVELRGELGMGVSIPDTSKYNMTAYSEALKDWQEKNNAYRPLTKEQTVYDGKSKTKSKAVTLHFNPEKDTYERRDVESDDRPGNIKLKTIEERKTQKDELIQKSIDERIERANAQPDSKVVNVHRTNDGRYIQGPITVYKHIDSKGFVQYKINPPGSESYLQSFFNIPGSPVLSPALQDYAMELYTNIQTA